MFVLRLTLAAGLTIEFCLTRDTDVAIGTYSTHSGTITAMYRRKLRSDFPLTMPKRIDVKAYVWRGSECL